MVIKKDKVQKEVWDKTNKGKKSPDEKSEK